MLLALFSMYIFENTQANKLIDQLDSNLVVSITLQKFGLSKGSNLRSEVFIQDRMMVKKIIDRINKFDGKITYGRSTEKEDGDNEYLIFIKTKEKDLLINTMGSNGLYISGYNFIDNESINYDLKGKWDIKDNEALFEISDYIVE